MLFIQPKPETNATVDSVRISVRCFPLVLLRTSDCLDPQELKVRRLDPSDSIFDTIAFCAPSPIASKTTTDNIPIIIQRLERDARSLFEANVRNALIICCQSDIKKILKQ